MQSCTATRQCISTASRVLLVCFIGDTTCNLYDSLPTMLAFPRIDDGFLNSLCGFLSKLFSAARPVLLFVRASSSK